jgi:copper chaperone NosL
MTRTTSRMTRSARALTLAATLLLGALYFTPMWSVRLIAPQYPEGLGMIIRLNTIEGMKEHDLRNINALNHYIGMKAIEPDAIPELRFMPWIVGGLIAAGLVVVALGRRRALVAWTIAFALLGAAGIFDFWRWSYDYGHNLDVENAIIVVPGMSYQPPLIGTKQLLNFTATSLPHVGGALAGIAFLLAGVAVLASYRRRAPIATASLALAAACATGAPTIALGVDACAECRMIIADPRFAALLVSSTGRTIKFDSIACLLEYLEAHRTDRPQRILVADAAASSLVFVPADAAVFVRDGAFRPPMGSTIALRANDPNHRRRVNGQALSWSQLHDAARMEAAHAR